MRNGQQRHRLAIQAATASKDEYGQDIQSWATEVTVWGRIVPMSGRELLNAQQIDATTTHKLRIRHRSDITNKKRVLFRSRTFEIIAILDHLEEQEYQDLMCKEVE